MNRWKWRAAVTVIVVGWICVLHLFVDAVRPEPEVLARDLTADLAVAWESTDAAQAAVADERAINPEWDFMGRTFLVLALASEQDDAALPIIDRIVLDTLATQAEGTGHAFLLPYSRRGAFRDPAELSLFVEGEIALMLAARLTLAPHPAFEAELRERTARITAQMRRGPVLSGERYPNECWTFCNTTALAALALGDRVLGEDHGDLLRDWVAMARVKLVDPDTGLLVSSYTWDGDVLDGPEGSSLWMSAHNLQAVDPEFAREQFEGAREALYRSALGFGWAKEWPRDATVGVDVDSGPVVPGLGASAGSSGLALLGATAFGDDNMRDALLRSMELAAFPMRRPTGRRYLAAGRIGNAVAAYALRVDPLEEAP